MSIRQIECPGCGSRDVTVVKVHNPDTKRLNSDCTLKCDKCSHEWEDKTTSDYHKRSQARWGVFI